MGFRHLICLTCLLWAIPATGLAQTGDVGSITGHVRGPGGISVPGATVLLLNPQSGERKETWTDESGNYAITDVPGGTYKLEVSLIGFQADVREPIPITARKNLKVNVALTLVTQAPITPEAAQDQGSPGSGFPPPSAGDGSTTRASGTNSQSSGGMGNGNGGGVRLSESQGGNEGVGNSSPEEPAASASAANSFLLSGGVGVSASMPGDDERSMRDRFRRFGEQMRSQSAPGFGGGGEGPGGPMQGGPSLEMMAVFAGAMGGGPRGPGGWRGSRPQINRVRGNFSNTYSNSALNAHPYPLNIPSSPQIAAYSERADMGLGGPLIIPKVYNGTNKTNFFFNYGLTRSKTPFDSLATVPTAAERAGDFSQAQITSGPLAGTVPVIYDPASNPSGPRTPFSNNQIPLGQVDSAALGLLQYVPLPNLPGQVQNFHLQRSLPQAADRFMVHVGHQISEKDSLNVMYFFNSSRSQSISNFPELTSRASTRGQNLSISETHTFAPGVMNTFSANFNRQRMSLLNPFAFQEDIAGDLGFQGISHDPFDWGVPIMQYTNFTALNDTIPSRTRNQTFRVFDLFLWIRGKHNVRVGGELRRVQFNTLTNPDARGTFTFSGYATSDFTAEGLPAANTGFDFADFLLGLPETTSVRFGSTANYLRSWVYSGYFQDDWRMTSHLTVNFGVRYEYFSPIKEKYGRLSDLLFQPGFASAIVVTGQNPGNLPESLLRADANNLAPRLGIAYRPWSQRSLVFRAGYGIFHDGNIYSRIFPNLASQPPFAEASTLITSPTQVLTLQNGFPAVSPNILKNTYAVDPDFRTPYAQSWNFSLEDEIFRNVIFSAGYVGTKGSKLDLLLAPNQSVASSSTAGQAGLATDNTLAFIYETSGAASQYHGLQLGLRRQFHNGFSMGGQYTYSKSIDNAAAVGGAGRTVAQDYLDLQAERGLSTFDLRHRLLVHYNYEFPFGDRKRWLSRGGFPARVIGNWEISGTSTIQSGNPFTARVLGNVSSVGGTAAIANLRADATGAPVGLSRENRTTENFFNAAAFAPPPPGELGNAGRNTIPGPGMVNFNASLQRSITFSREKGIRGSLRISADNLFNTPTWAGLATVVNGQGFGRVTSVRSMRSIDISFRVRF